MSEAIREAVQGAIGYLTEHPDEARYTDSLATATVVDGLRVRVGGPDGAVLETDMPASVGGTNAAPSPGWMLRAAIASCVVMRAVMRAAEQGVELGDLRVEVDSESDDRGILGIDDDVPSGPLSVAVRVRARGGDDVRQVVEWAFEHCPVTDAIARAVPVSLEFSAP